MNQWRNKEIIALLCHQLIYYIWPTWLIALPQEDDFSLVDVSDKYRLRQIHCYLRHDRKPLKHIGPPLESSPVRLTHRLIGYIQPEDNHSMVKFGFEHVLYQ